MQARSQPGVWVATSHNKKTDCAKERDWQFKVADGKSHEADNGIGYFEKRAGELAMSLGCRLVAMKNVHLEKSREESWLVKGTAILENPRENIPATAKAKN
jgi:hypothetical protein